MDFQSHLESEQGFMESCQDYEGSRIVLFGAPMDYTVSYRPGSRMAAGAIRRVSRVLEEHSLALGKDLREIRFFDGGDLALPLGNVDKSLQIIEEAWKSLLIDGKLPLMMGGDHLVTFPAVKAAAALYPDLAVLQLDAHADLRPHYLGEENSHASVMYRIYRETGVKDIYQLGIRSATWEELSFARQNTRFFPFDILKPLEKIKAELTQRPLYVTLDIDVVDPAFAPGTGTPEPGGCSSREILEAVYNLSGLRVVGFDLVEVAPDYDSGQITSLLAAKIIREIILTHG